MASRTHLSSKKRPPPLALSTPSWPQRKLPPSPPMSPPPPPKHVMLLMWSNRDSTSASGYASLSVCRSGLRVPIAYYLFHPKTGCSLSFSGMQRKPFFDRRNRTNYRLKNSNLYCDQIDLIVPVFIVRYSYYKIHLRFTSFEYYLYFFVFQFFYFILAL